MSTGCERRQLSGPGLYRLLSGCCAGLMLMAGCDKAPPPVDIHTIEEVVIRGRGFHEGRAGTRCDGNYRNL